MYKNGGLKSWVDMGGGDTNSQYFGIYTHTLL